MRYTIGDILICSKKVNARELEMRNPDIDICPGERFKVTDRDDYPYSSPSHWYELTSMADSRIVLNAWNDGPDHMVVNDNFEPEEQ